MPADTKTHRRRKPTPIRSALNQRAILAQRLDRLADFELHLGHHGAAELLAHKAVELRGAV